MNKVTINGDELTVYEVDLIRGALIVMFELLTKNPKVATDFDRAEAMLTSMDLLERIKGEVAA